MTGSLVLGALSGLTIGLLAVGVVLVYKAHRFINLAHGQLGVVSAALLAKLVVEAGWSWWTAFPVAIAVGIGIALVVERFVVRRLRARTSSAISLLLLTIGIAQLLLALTYVKAIGPDGVLLQKQGYPMPIGTQWEIAGVVLDGSYILVLLCVPAVIAALTAFMRWSGTGRMIRASASNPDAARLCGIPVARMGAVTWAIAGGLSALAAVLQAPSQPSFNAEALGPGLLLRALGAAACGGFVSLPWALAGAIGLGLTEHIALHVTHDGGRAELVVLLAIVVVLVVRGRAIAAAGRSEASGIDVQRPTRVPAAVAGRAIVRHHRAWLGLAGLTVALLVPHLPYFRPEDRRFLLVLLLLYALVGVALTMVVGWSGQVSLGHMALVGVGAYVAARFVGNGWSMPAVLAVAALVGAAVTVVVAIPALRLQGLTLAVTTLGLAVVGPAWLFRQPWFGSAQSVGLAVEPPTLLRGLGDVGSQLAIYHLALALLSVVLLATSALQRSVAGRLILAVRDDERAAATLGFTPATVKLGVLALSGAVAAMTGVLWAVAWQSVSVAQFSPHLSLSVLAVPVIGGLGSLAGAAAGAVLLYMPAFFLSSWFSSLFGNVGSQIGFQLALGGLALVGTLLSYPSGVAGAVQQAWEALLHRIAAGLARDKEAASPLPLVVEDVSLSFGGVRALDGASVEVGPGEIVGLIGPNGAGKTTLINVVSGVLEAETGSVRVFGREMVGLPVEYRAHHGLTRSFQGATLFPGLTVEQTVQLAMSRTERVGLLSSMWGAPWGRALDRRSRARARDVIERFGLTAWRDTLTGDLSTGTRRLCELAVQVAAAPRVLVLDEPTAGVAQREAEAFGPVLRSIRDELGCSILIVEHDMPLLMGLCDRIYAMDGGRVIAEGTPSAIRDDPAVVASYLGTDETAISRSGARGPRRNGRRKLTATPTPTKETIG